MVHVIVVNGRHRVGKDSFIYGMIDAIHKYIVASEVIYKSSIDLYKKYLIELGWDGKTKTDDVRQLLTDMKQFSINHGDIPTKILMEYIVDLRFNDNAHNFFITQIREQEEISKLELACSGLLKVIGGITFDKVFIVGKQRDNTKGSTSDFNVKYDDSYYVVKNDATLSELEEHANNYILDIIRRYSKNGDK